MRTVYDIWVFTPQGRSIVACTWRSDYVDFLFDELVHKPDIANINNNVININNIQSRWTGAAMWREI